LDFSKLERVAFLGIQEASSQGTEEEGTQGEEGLEAFPSQVVVRPSLVEEA